MEARKFTPDALLKISGRELTLLTGEVVLGWKRAESYPCGKDHPARAYRMELPDGSPLCKTGRHPMPESATTWHNSRALAEDNVPALADDANTAAVLRRHIRLRGVTIRQAYLTNLTNILRARLGVSVVWPAAEFYVEPADHCRAAILTTSGLMVPAVLLPPAGPSIKMLSIAAERANPRIAEMGEVALLLRLAANDEALNAKLSTMLMDYYALNPEHRPGYRRPA